MGLRRTIASVGVLLVGYHVARSRAEVWTLAILLVLRTPREQAVAPIDAGDAATELVDKLRWPLALRLTFGEVVVPWRRRGGLWGRRYGWPTRRRG